MRHTALPVLLALTTSVVLGSGTAEAATPHPAAPHPAAPRAAAATPSPPVHRAELGQPDIPQAEQNLGYAVNDLMIILRALI